MGSDEGTRTRVLREAREKHTSSRNCEVTSNEGGLVLASRRKNPNAPPLHKMPCTAPRNPAMPCSSRRLGSTGEYAKKSWAVKGRLTVALCDCLSALFADPF